MLVRCGVIAGISLFFLIVVAIVNGISVKDHYSTLPTFIRQNVNDLSTISLQSRWPRCKHDPEWVYVLEIARKRKPKSKKDFATYLLEATAQKFTGAKNIAVLVSNRTHSARAFRFDFTISYPFEKPDWNLCSYNRNTTRIILAYATSTGVSKGSRVNMLPVNPKEILYGENEDGDDCRYTPKWAQFMKPALDNCKFPNSTELFMKTTECVKSAVKAKFSRSTMSGSAMWMFYNMAYYVTASIDGEMSLRKWSFDNFTEYCWTANPSRYLPMNGWSAFYVAP